jgi:hypothetical protein
MLVEIRRYRTMAGHPDVVSPCQALDRWVGRTAVLSE